MIDAQEKTNFFDVCEAVIAGGRVDAGIGSLGEKYMHLIFKHFLCSDTDCHEVGQGSFVADVVVEDTIYEIQTGGYYPLRRKLEYYLQETDKRVIIVTPMVARRRIMWVDPICGAVTAGRETKTHGEWTKRLSELFWIAEYLVPDRVSLWFPIVSVDDYRKQDGQGKDAKLKATKLQKIPKELIDMEEARTQEDLARLFLPTGLPTRFTAKQFAVATGAKRMVLFRCIKALLQMGLIQQSGREGRAAAYQRLI